MNKIVTVLGMGRSGTSLACQALSKMGVFFGSPLLGPTKRNERGHWEHIRIKNSQIRMTSKKGINSFFFAGPMPEINDPEKEHILAEIVDYEMTKCTLFGFKEPLVTRVWNVWERIFNILNAKPIVIACFRDPGDVYKSLLHEGEAVSFDNSYARRMVNRLWAEYSHEIGKISVNAELWFEDWETKKEEQLKRLARAVDWTGPLPDKVFDPKLVHV